MGRKAPFGQFTDYAIGASKAFRTVSLKLSEKPHERASLLSISRLIAT